MTITPHRLEPLRHDRFPLIGFRKHRRYYNDGPVAPHLTMPSVQSESDVLAAVRNEFGVDHYNPRLLPAIPQAVDWSCAWLGVVCIGNECIVVRLSD